MTYRVDLDVYQGAEENSRFRTTYDVEEEGQLSALSKAEQAMNVLLPDEQYAVARHARPVIDPRPAAGMTVVMAEAA